MAGTPSTLAQHVAAASRGDRDSFYQVINAYGEAFKRSEALPTELQLFDARTVTAFSVNNLATTTDFDTKVKLLRRLQTICYIDVPRSNADVVIAAGAFDQVVQQCLSSPSAKLQDAA